MTDATPPAAAGVCATHTRSLLIRRAACATTSPARSMTQQASHSPRLTATRLLGPHTPSDSSSATHLCEHLDQAVTVDGGANLLRAGRDGEGDLWGRGEVVGGGRGAGTRAAGTDGSGAAFLAMKSTHAGAHACSLVPDKSIAMCCSVSGPTHPNLRRAYFWHQGQKMSGWCAWGSLLCMPGTRRRVRGTKQAPPCTPTRQLLMPTRPNPPWP
jgi:hypothetical protein